MNDIPEKSLLFVGIDMLKNPQTAAYRSFFIKISACNFPETLLRNAVRKLAINAQPIQKTNPLWISKIQYCNLQALIMPFIQLLG
ncbi:hypothetical protein [Pararcticibacter amylolyticus]|uniref:Uncharacterized protein n=1 Tax=Pararcticibacter amylolyticus TaxID=2173175 RepID=A0A2U2PCP4_9SPHI|nr:hypothetical protein [Pararcticibacter amylolyticus]PWG79171.1 hypothetical protein DDR33_17930 [Pararcticibacter amylolyticus]